MPESGTRARRADASPRASASAELPGLHVRVATLDDLDTVVAFRLALLREHAASPIYGRLRDDAPERARKLFAAQLMASGEVALLAVANAPATSTTARADRPVGIMRCMESRGSPLLDPPRYGYVASVYVVPDARRFGVVRQLIDKATAWCTARGLDEIRLHVASDNDGGNAAWSALGFETVEHLRVRRIVTA